LDAGKKIPRIGQRIETFLKIKGNMLDQAEKDQSLTVEPGLSDEVFEESAVGSLRKKLEQVTKERDEARLKCMVKDRALWLWLCPTEDFDAALDSCVEMGLPREVKSAIMYALSPAALCQCWPGSMDRRRFRERMVLLQSGRN